jgi:hypothetical protein
MTSGVNYSGEGDAEVDATSESIVLRPIHVGITIAIIFSFVIHQSM